jgi:hypothetical protein
MHSVNSCPGSKIPKHGPEVPYGLVAYDFLKANPAKAVYPAGPPMPATDSQAAAQ